MIVSVKQPATIQNVPFFDIADPHVMGFESAREPEQVHRRQHDLTGVGQRQIYYNLIGADPETDILFTVKCGGRHRHGEHGRAVLCRGDARGEPVTVL